MENNRNLASYLRQVPFMRELPALYRQELANICTLQHFSVGEEIIPQGFITDRFFVVAQGHVHFRRTDAQGLWQSAGDATVGQHFGLAMFTTQALSKYKASALEDTYLFVMERQAFDRLVEAQPDILKAMRPIYLRRYELTHGFKWLTPGEDVVLTTHRHWFALFESLVPPVISTLILAGVLAASSYFGLLADLNLPPLLAGLPALVLVGWFAYAINDYLDDDFIVTNKRVAHVERVFVKRELRYQIPNERIQSISVRYAGPLASALKLSDLEVRSAGRADSRIVFDRVARAEKIRSLIQEQRGNLRAHDEAEMRRRFRARVEKDLTPYIYKKDPDDGEGETGGDRLRRSWSGYASGVWRRVFGRKFVDGDTVTYRKQWVALVRQAGVSVLALLVLSAALLIYVSVPALQLLPRTPTLAAFGFLILINLGGLIWQWEDWRNDIYQVTNTQIVDIERLPFGLWSRSTEALLVNVQDARALRPHALNSILNFGNVEVQTAGGGPPLTFYDVPNPEEIVEEIFRRMEGHRLRVMEHQMVVFGQQVTDALITYDHMKEKQVLQQGESAPSPAQLASVEAPSLQGGQAEIHEMAQDEQEDTDEGQPTTGGRGETIGEFSFMDEGDE